MSSSPIRFDEVRAWLFGQALPLWAGAGLDREHGGSVEVLSLEGRPGDKPFKRPRVQGRQVYAFTHAHLLGWDGPALEAAEHCWAFLKAHGQREDGAWIRRMGRAGGAVDATADAYDIGTVLFAIGWRAKAGAPGAMAEAHRSLDALDRLLGLGQGEGWRAAEDDPSLLLNPHMHLLEAAIELADAGDQRFADLAKGMLELFRTRMFDAERGVVLERYGAGWAQPQERIVWPGHQYEWVWILGRASRVLGMDLTAEARALYDFAEAHGLDPDVRLADDELKGEALEPCRTFRAWPQTEALKANLAMFEQGLDTRARIAETLAHLLDRYLRMEPLGGWHDRLDVGLKPIAADIPASILYHLVLAFSELLRLEPQLRARA